MINKYTTNIVNANSGEYSCRFTPALAVISSLEYYSISTNLSLNRDLNRIHVDIFIILSGIKCNFILKTNSGIKFQQVYLFRQC